MPNILFLSVVLQNYVLDVEGDVYEDHYDLEDENLSDNDNKHLEKKWFGKKRHGLWRPRKTWPNWNFFVAQYISKRYKKINLIRISKLVNGYMTSDSMNE